MAWIDARLSHTGNGIYGAMWAAALASAALVAQDVAEVLDAAETVVPPGSHLAEAVRCGRSAGERARAAVDAGAEVEAALAAGLDELHAAYGHLHWVHVLNNAATIAFALASGDGDFGVSVGAAVSAGWDTDSVGATVGGVVGALAGASGLPERWTTALEGRIATSLPGGERRIADLAARTRALSTATSTAEGSGTVVVVGSANVDLVVPVARHPEGGETLLGGDLRRNPGGKGANQAVAAARAGGARTSLIGAVGTDDAGDLLLASLASAGVRTDLVERHSQAPTGVALITVTGDGENAIVVAPGANALVRVGPEAASRIAAADVVLAQLETPLDAVRAAAAALSPGAVLVLNAAPSAPLPDDVWSMLDILVVNEHEAADLAGCSDPDVGVGMLLERVPAVVVTLGGAGSIVARRGEPPMRLAGVRVEAVDTTGAGDTFCGVLCAALAQGADLADAVRRAGAAGALAVTRPGAQDAVPTAAEVSAFVAAADNPSGRDDRGGTR
jgi:ribokinase